MSARILQTLGSKTTNNWLKKQRCGQPEDLHDLNRITLNLWQWIISYKLQECYNLPYVMGQDDINWLQYKNHP